ncbi:MAG: rhodanese-like domain-containing protein [Piscirickettsiaceae bacterium]|nr:rhodanese-like domain-containing protein [Piscirickettsiaceae bacterium]
MSKTAMELVQHAKSIITEVTLAQAISMLDDSSIALDVRELLEYQTGHIPDAFHISRGMLEFMIASHPEFQDKNTSIVVYCKTGGRSALATATLQQLGFTNVHSMLGGFDAWAEDDAIPPETQA